MRSARRDRSARRRGEGYNDPFETTRSCTDEETAMLAEAAPHSMASAARLLANVDAVEHIVRRDVPGALVECGVWRGGSVLIMIRALQRLGVKDRDFYLYDTFDGMTAPSPADTSDYSPPALQTWNESAAAGRKPWDWLFKPDAFTADLVRTLLHETGYPPERVHFVVGPVEDTLPATLPEAIAVLRLDTDWYESTAHELTHLYPRVSADGVLIIDDYGHWDGARRAVDEYFATSAPPILLSRLDYTGRMGIKS